MLAPLLLAASAAAVTAQLALLSPGPHGSAQACLYDIETGALTPIGPGRDDGPPVWAPDGSRVAFETTPPGGGRVIWIATPDGEAEPIPHFFEYNTAPAWDISGRRLAYSAGDSGADRRLVVYELGAPRETIWGGDQRGLLRPVWLGGRALDLFVGAAQEYGWRDGVAGTLLREASRDGALVVAGLAPREGGGLGTALFVVSQQAAIEVPPIVLASSGTYEEWLPAVHPREERIAFESNDGGDREIFVLSFRSGTFSLSNHFAADWNPVWTPDLGWLAFESFRSGRRGLYRGNVESVRVEPIESSTEHDNWGISYAPEGGAFVFVSNRDGRPTLYLKSGLSGEVRRLPGLEAGAGSPAWRPAP